MTERLNWTELKAVKERKDWSKNEWNKDLVVVDFKKTSLNVLLLMRKKMKQHMRIITSKYYNVPVFFTDQ